MPLPAPRLRDATEADAAAIAAIYAIEVRDHVNTYETVVPDQAEMLRRMRAILAAGHPWLVAELDGQVIGYAYSGGWRERAAYRHTVENSVYVSPSARRHGAGAMLLQALIDGCTRRGFRQMIAVIGDPANAASIRLHERFGFRTVGVFAAVGHKHGRWLDVVQMQRPLGPAASQPPDALDR